MEVLVITSSKRNESEVEKVIGLFENGLETLHLRKPKFKDKEMEQLIQQIPAEYHSRIVIHGHYHLALKYNLKGIHLQRRHRKPEWKNRWLRFRLKMRRPDLQVSTSFRSMQSLIENKWDFDYVFLGPLFKEGAHYHEDDLATVNSLKNQLKLSKHRVFATGGIQLNNLAFLNKVGFNGIGLSSLVWKSMNSNDYLKIMQQIKAA